MAAPWSEEEAAYAELADELNDGDVQIWCARCRIEQPVQVKCEGCGNDLDPLACFDHDLVVTGEKYAAEHGLAWPPQVGDFDRYWERIERTTR